MLALIKNFDHEVQMIQNYIRKNASRNGTINILEAGCGQTWSIDLKDIKYHLTGIDIDKDALEIRKFKTKDLDEIIQGDLRTVSLNENQFDVIYNSYVLEHIDGAERVLENFHRWLKPNGLMILRFPDRNSAYGFITRLMPFWVHIFFKKYMMGDPNAGKPGFAPYPTYYDRVISQDGIRKFCKEHHMVIREEWGHPYPMEWDRFPTLLSIAVRIPYVFSFGKLAYAHNNLTYILEKQEEPAE